MCHAITLAMFTFSFTCQILTEYPLLSLAIYQVFSVPPKWFTLYFVRYCQHLISFLSGTVNLSSLTSIMSGIVRMSSSFLLLLSSPPSLLSCQILSVSLHCLASVLLGIISISSLSHFCLVRYCQYLHSKDNEDIIPFCVAMGDAQQLVTYLHDNGQLMDAVIASQAACEETFCRPQLCESYERVGDGKLVPNKEADSNEWYSRTLVTVDICFLCIVQQNSCRCSYLVPMSGLLSSNSFIL